MNQKAEVSNIFLLVIFSVGGYSHRLLQVTHSEQPILFLYRKIVAKIDVESAVHPEARISG